MEHQRARQGPGGLGLVLPPALGRLGPHVLPSAAERRHRRHGEQRSPEQASGSKPLFGPLGLPDPSFRGVAEPEEWRPVSCTLAAAHPERGPRSGGPSPAGGPGAGRLLSLLGGSGRPRRHPSRPTRPRLRLRRADGLRGRLSAVTTTRGRCWEGVRAPPSRAYTVPGPVPAVRAGESLLILFPRTGTGTVFILENGAGVSSALKGKGARF